MKERNIKDKTKKSTEKIYFSDLECDKCDCTMNNDLCAGCISEANSMFYRDFRRIAPKADKVIVIARNSNWKGNTGFLVVPFDNNVLRHIFGKTSDYSKKVYRSGRSMFITGYSHDTPMGGQWLLKPICSNGASNEFIIQKAMKKYT